MLAFVDYGGRTNTLNSIVLQSEICLRFSQQKCLREFTPDKIKISKTASVSIKNDIIHTLSGKTTQNIHTSTYTFMQAGYFFLIQSNSRRVKNLFQVFQEPCFLK